MNKTLFKMVGVVVLLGLSLTSGCTFYALNGNGPMKRSSLTPSLPTANASELARWKNEVYSLKATSTVKDEPYQGYTLNFGIDIVGTPLIYHESTYRALFLPNDNGKRTILAKSDGWGFLFPLFGTVSGGQLDAETGEYLSKRDITHCTALIVHSSKREPTKSAMSEYLQNQKTLDDVEYNRYSGTCLCFGLLAWGQKNNRAYLQIAWIPIPLWNLD